jgi:acetolactate synthase-1/2/3 large subunit
VIQVATYISNSLVNFGVRHVFMVTGGGAMFLNYAIGTNPNLKTIFNHHEQASAIAAEGYARITNQPGVVNVTSGPGGINALNGVFGAFTDSIPMLIISGQVKRETYIRNYDLPGLRQLGDQEADIISLARNITKYAVTISNPQEIRYHLEKAWYLAQAGRPGPCWLDIPIDVQSSQVDENMLQEFTPPAVDPAETENLHAQVKSTLEKLKASNRPVILAGTGVRAAGAVDLFNQVVHKLGIPVTTAWTHDLIASDDPLFCGRPGTIGTRPGNFTVQNSDVLLILGSRLNIRQTGYAWNSFARTAYKIWVDIDPPELSKPTVKPDLPIVADVGNFLLELDRQLPGSNWKKDQFADWLAWCQERVKHYPPVSPHQRQFNGRINPYHFMESLFDQLNDEDVVVTGNASACIISFQTARIKLGQRLFSNSGSASMGYDLPAAIGAAVAHQGRVICLAGDGSLQLNIQELQTVAQYALPVKIIVLNNNGYLSIRTSQKNFFGGTVGESPKSGVGFPDYVKVAEAYGIPSLRIEDKDFIPALLDCINSPGPMLCEVMLDPEQGFEPRQSSRSLPDGRIISAPLEDMYPFLDRKEVLENLLIPPWEGS